MVSSALNMELQELLDTLARVRQEFSDSPEYQTLRQRLPADWPM
jgi:hypothetical protein